MSEASVVNTENPARTLSPEEIQAANRGYRARLAKSFSRYPSVRRMISAERWDEPAGSESVFPVRYPGWKYTISRSQLEIIVRTELLGEKLNSDNLTIGLIHDNPGIGFIKAVQGNVVEVLNETSDILTEAEGLVSRVEEQLGRK